MPPAPSSLAGDDLRSAAQADLERALLLAAELTRADPRLAPLSAFTIANDRVGAERALAAARAGIPVEALLMRVGSYGRFGFVLAALDEGLTTREWVLERLVRLWRDSDPDDTDPRALALWRAAWEANGRTPLLDGPPPRDARAWTVWRGQDAEAPLGIAWSRDPAVARRFARGLGTRQGDRGGRVFRARLDPSRALAYLVGRSEREVVLDPAELADLR